ncbi:LptF/LptG family permease [Rhodohalobacter sulfatireducens]|uniref:LptF/LptG family permease n=1 Tax=Rhodohalobacter sulfatireducens TaxID=2911366 RepID=A0ABS9KE49_9BACT|nr:LptF/LptG family permease [Rhodohalobacter sulfatireducens]MCG2589101.1 LptF/LptG family permease [Rhodohalobacter sulfatireducens]MDR9408035.1 LptF/LptG family permease [Balneolaceae bacterium]
MKKLDRYIFFRILVLTVFMLAVLICIFILIDFSENSDDFADKGATFAQIWNQYYFNYIPEMVRLVTPLAVFTACLFLTGQMTERLEITAIKASGISLYRLVVPYLLIGIFLAGMISYLDAYIIPEANSERIDFEQEFLSSGNERIDRGGIFRQDSDSTVIEINFFDPNTNTAYRVFLTEFNGNEIERITQGSRMMWVDSTSHWVIDRPTTRIMRDKEVEVITSERKVFDINILPRDLARRTSDIYQLTYPKAFQYIQSIERIGAGGISLPKVQLYGRITYPLSIIVVCLIGFALAADKRKGGKGFYIAAGLGISFIYLVLMKVIEPFGAAGTLSPMFAAVFPHAFFLIIGILLLLFTRK